MPAEWELLLGIYEGALERPTRERAPLLERRVPRGPRSAKILNQHEVAVFRRADAGEDDRTLIRRHAQTLTERA